MNILHWELASLYICFNVSSQHQFSVSLSSMWISLSSSFCEQVSCSFLFWLFIVVPILRFTNGDIAVLLIPHTQWLCRRARAWQTLRYLSSQWGKRGCVHLLACACVHFCCASWLHCHWAFSRCGICWLSVRSLSLPDIVQSGIHEEHEAWSREPQEPGRALCGLRHSCEGEADVAPPGRYSQSWWFWIRGPPGAGRGRRLQHCPVCLLHFPRVSAVLIIQHS